MALFNGMAGPATSSISIIMLSPSVLINGNRCLLEPHIVYLNGGDIKVMGLLFEVSMVPRFLNTVLLFITVTYTSRISTQAHSTMYRFSFGM